jgi:carbamoyl-phosphate synthase large subunit
MTTILITAIGGDIGQGVATIVGEDFPGWRRLGIDTHERHGGSLLVEKTFQAPRVDDPCYDSWLADLVRRERVDLCVPTSEAEIIHLSRRPDLSVAGATLVMANPEAIDIGSDKLKTAEFLGTLGLERPWTIPVESFSGETALPCVFKTRRGAGSKAVFVCHRPEEVAFYRDRYPSAILQELLLPADMEVTCAVYRNHAGATSVLQLLRSLVGGFTAWAQVVEDRDVHWQCVRVAEALNLRGSINVQLRMTEAGPRIFEINPRFSSTLLIRHRMGYRDVVWSLQEACGDKVTMSQPPAGVVGVRVQGAAIASRALPGAEA